MVKFKCNPTSTPCSPAKLAARSESSMNTIALTDDTDPRQMQVKVLSVVVQSRPQSSAFTMILPELKPNLTLHLEAKSQRSSSLLVNNVPTMK